MHISASRTLDGRADLLYSWWSDYTEGVIDDSRFTKVTRRIVSRNSDSLLMEDVFSRPFRFVDTVSVVLKPPDRIEFHSRSRVWNADGEYRFIQKDDKIDVSVDVELIPQGIWKIAFALPFVGGRIRREFEQDLSGHLGEFTKDSAH